MKPSASALVGAIVIGGSWMSLPAVAFAGEARPGISTPSASNADVAAFAKAAHAQSASCNAGNHTHSSTCTCARCAAAQAE